MSVHRFVNLTDHPVTVLAEGRSVTYPPSGMVARVVTRYKSHEGGETQYDTHGNVIPMYGAVDKGVVGVPAYNPQSEDMYIVSGIVLAHPSMAGRADLCAPADTIKDKDARVIGTRGFIVRYAK